MDTIRVVCRLTGIAILALAPGGFTSEASAQPSCRVEYTTWNSNRLVLGPVDAECRVGIWPWKHSRPFGNWGVKTESSGKQNGYQFEGWCNNHSVRDPEDGNRLKTFCRDGWYEWNSCTFHGWSPPNRDFYNHDNYRQQKSTTGRSNNHGGGVVWIATGCPTDTNRDGRADSGGCKDALGQSFTIANHRMELYECKRSSGQWKAGSEEERRRLASGCGPRGGRPTACWAGPLSGALATE